MKSTGIVRKVDELGRIVLPIELRRTLDIAEKDALEIYVEGDRIILHKDRDTCIFCDGTRDLCDFKGRFICADCLAKLKSDF
ncbi:MAG: AbrB/MazE/SpoVT family DNA-binding domain-containing protein [Eubacteriales bacterium]|nr:AbrB/MazE/SpoVT family DNA-binding domain-containing protein [Eubacteriales bacterium]